MNWSLGELGSLSRKASYGAGYSWGHAEEIDMATQWLAQYGLNSVKSLTGLLSWYDRNGIAQKTENFPMPAVATCPITLGTQMIDVHLTLSNRPCSLGPVHYPVFLMPFVAWTAKILKKSIKLSIYKQGVYFSSNGDFQTDHADAVTNINRNINNAHADDLNKVILNFAESDIRHFQHRIPLLRRASVDASCIQILENYAQRTYAPASDESRQKGAGPGLADQD